VEQELTAKHESDSGKRSSPVQRLGLLLSYRMLAFKYTKTDLEDQLRTVLQPLLSRE
jgi:hypothetical protein